MPDVIAQVSFQSRTMLPRDRFENVWHFTTTDASPGTLDDWQTLAGYLAAFYNDDPGTGASIVSWYASSLVPAVTIKMYSESDPKPRPILYQNAFDMVSQSISEGMPEQVALCLSYYTDRNIAGHRGRVFLGPFGRSAIAAPTSLKISRPHDGLVATIKQSAENLINKVGSGLEFLTSPPVPGPTAASIGGWALRSTKGGLQYNLVQHGWVDNEWDIQRRRAVRADARVVF